MSYVSIWRPVRDQIVQASQNAQNEIIGLLLGQLDDDTMVISNSVTGEFQAREHGATLPTETLAKIADDLVSGRTKGSIVGWYHSHTEGGLFLSDTDIETQKKLQQFSSLVTAMVVDAKSGDTGYFRVDSQTGRQIRIAEENITVFEERSDAIPVKRKGRTAVRATPTVEIRTRQPGPGSSESTRRLILAALVIVLVASMVLLGFIFTRPPSAVPLAIIHTPVQSATVGTPIVLLVNVTGNASSVSLHYAPLSSDSFTKVEMGSVAPEQFEYTLPAGKVTANMKYFIDATDALGNQAQTGVYTIPVGDFTFYATTQTLTVYRTGSSSSPIKLGYVNGFAEPVKFSASGAPPGVTVSFNPNPAVSGDPQLTMMVSADSSAPVGSYPLQIAGTYTPAGGEPIVRQTGTSLLISDFDLQVSPTSRTVTKSQAATYTVAITVTQGFVDPVQITVQGLPQGATYELTTSGTSAVVGGPGTTTFTLRVVTPSSLKAGTYAVTVIAMGGGVSHSLTVQLIVR